MIMVWLSIQNGAPINVNGGKKYLARAKNNRWTFVEDTNSYVDM